ncbi:MAG: phytanoyl-CoA dioxygenase family protein, partial [Myxococcales bacterium]|nr:phytanoyl-CoA dioxygenase family protein [Myxococcales bacterium]
AICDLLGGRERVATTHWSNYINANLRSSLRGASTIVPPTADSWHLDDPRTDTRLDRIRNGLLTVVMFGDVLPASGGTQIAPDSIGLVARVLAEHPDGYDFVDSDAGARITRQCREFLELTGEAGDVVLLHPFMIHTAAPNPSGRIRWMSNPMIHARGFLDFFRDDPAELSPIELAVARALAASPGASEDAARRQRPKGAS